METNEIEFQIALVGACQTGKTSSIINYLEGYFIKEYVPTVGFDTFIQRKSHKGLKQKLVFLDTSGQFVQKPAMHMCMKNADAILLFCDPNYSDPIEQCKAFIFDLDEQARKTSIKGLLAIRKDEEKLDLQKNNDLKSFAKSNSLNIWLVSGKNALELAQVIDFLLIEMIKKL